MCFAHTVYRFLPGLAQKGKRAILVNMMTVILNLKSQIKDNSRTQCCIINANCT